MDFAVACNGLDVAKRFDSAECFTCYSVSLGRMKGCRTLPNLNIAVSEIASIFCSAGIKTLVCGEIAQRERDAFEDAGVEVVSGVAGNASDAACDYLREALSGSCDED